MGQCRERNRRTTQRQRRKTDKRTREKVKRKRKEEVESLVKVCRLLRKNLVSWRHERKRGEMCQDGPEPLHPTLLEKQRKINMSLKLNLIVVFCNNLPNPTLLKD